MRSGGRARTRSALGRYCALLVMLLLSPGVAALEYEGSVLVGQPTTASPVWGIGTRLASCDPDSTFNGIDVVWFALPEEATGWGPVNVTLEMAGTLDAGVYFWSAECDLFLHFDCARNGLGAAVRCMSPEGTAFVSVEGYAGTGVFTLRIEEPVLVAAPCMDCLEEEPAAGGELAGKEAAALSPLAVLAGLTLLGALARYPPGPPARARRSRSGDRLA